MADYEDQEKNPTNIISSKSEDLFLFQMWPSVVKTRASVFPLLNHGWKSMGHFTVNAVAYFGYIWDWQCKG